jgi:pimeloyl-ACP methyl ester carboxylesterase
VKPAHHEQVVPFTALDGLPLNLIHVLGSQPPTRGPVILVHGAGVRANLFRAPTPINLVDVLVAEGYDVWLENWRASIDFPPNLWTLDQAALYDHPRAVQKLVEETGAETIKAIVHCQGSTSFTMSALAGLLPQVDTIVTNAVSLHTVVPRWSRFKLNWVVPVLHGLTPYLDAQWGIRAPHLTAKVFRLVVRLAHRECDNAICKMVSFTYGSGFPALWRHQNLDEATHEWLKGEFAHVPVRFFRQMARCVRRGHLVAVEGLPGLPADFAAQPPLTTARFALFAGTRSGCFLPESQIRSHAFLDSFRRDYHTLHLLAGYSHLDVFIGKDAARDVFPLILSELAQPGTCEPVSS